MEIKQGYKQTEVGVIPEDWDVKELGKMGEFKNGINKSAEDFGFGSPFINLMDVFGKFEIKKNTPLELINSNNFEKKTYNLKKGDVLFIRSSVKPSGVGLTAMVKDDIVDTVFSGFLIRFRENNFLNDEYKKYCFYTERFRSDLMANSTISANTNINQVALKKLKIGFPTNKSEQTAITNALSDMDSLVSQTEKLIEKKKAIKQGAMQELLKPKEGWVTRKFTDVVNFIHGKAHEQFIVENGKYEVVNSKFISTDGKVKKFSNQSFLTAKKGDVLTVLSDLPNGKALAKCFYVEYDNKYSVNQRICIWRSVYHYPKFLYYLLNRHEYFMALNDGVSQTHILNGHIEKFYIKIPENYLEQQSIAETLWDIDQELQLMETKLTKLKQQKQGMMQALLTGKIRLVS